MGTTPAADSLDENARTDVFCANCGLDRSGDPEITATDRPPCPRCGEKPLRYARSFQASVAVSVAFHTSVIPGVQDRNWRIRWQQIQDELPVVSRRRTEARSAAAILGATQELFDFFVLAYHLKDYLIADQIVPKGTVESAISASAVLSRLADLANLDKHRKPGPQFKPRSGEWPVVGQICDSANEEGGWRLVVDIRHKGESVDGVSFAETVVDEWRKLLSSWSLT
jgi:hypothetical protein